MTNDETILIELSLAERHTLTDLLTTYLDERAFEAVKFAKNSIELERAAERTRRLALIKALAEGEPSLPRADLTPLRVDLISWASETDATVEEHEDMIVKVDEDEERSEAERAESISRLRGMSAVDYAHQCVCERIVAQIDAAREGVLA
jgi:hypothetical protein